MWTRGRSWGGGNAGEGVVELVLGSWGDPPSVKCKEAKEESA